MATTHSLQYGRGVAGLEFLGTATPRPYCNECVVAIWYLYLLSSGMNFFIAANETTPDITDNTCRLVSHPDMIL